MKLYIKYLVSIRCKNFVKEELKKLGIVYYRVESGFVEIADELPKKQRLQLEQRLLTTGMVLLEAEKNNLVENTKKILTELINSFDPLLEKSYTKIISSRLSVDFAALSNQFAEVNGYSIEHYISLQKIEAVKELLLYENLTVSQIAEKFHYPHVNLLTAHFKKTTGLPPSFFIKLRKKRFQV